MSSRNMCLLPRATLHSDSEQFIYNWMLEDDLDLDQGNWKEAKRTRGKATTLSVMLDQGRQRRLREQRAFMQTKVVMWIHAN